MSSIKNPLAAILDSNKFTGLNYLYWLLNLYIVLALEKLLYTLEKSPPKEAPADVNPEELTKLNKCSNMMRRRFVVATGSPAASFYQSLRDFSQVLVVAQYKVRILSLYFSEERSLDEVQDGCVGFPCLLLSWLRTVYAICVIAAFHMFICLYSSMLHTRMPPCAEWLTTTVHGRGNNKLSRSMHLVSGSSVMASGSLPHCEHTPWPLFVVGNPGSTAGRGFNPAGGAPGGG
ncbi:folylpolyglutamate synthase [Dorcoceras hygrometricum]|uniref:Folylpolyglutamate synthase n=1 Tax=Dorcoceras hygrometricum TaxID=472368 RepID=A0A2Z7A4E9_9LAMI|nr:folylpolyglutamate synthase [Dorcoceras hygrometricum]